MTYGNAVISILKTCCQSYAGCFQMRKVLKNEKHEMKSLLVSSIVACCFDMFYIMWAKNAKRADFAEAKSKRLLENLLGG